MNQELNFQIQVSYHEGFVQSVQLFSSQLQGIHCSFSSSKKDFWLEMSIHEWVESYRQKKNSSKQIPFNFATLPPFTQKVLQVIASIPMGTVYTYGQIGEMINCPKGGRAVGGACGRNPFPLFIPCHRVVAAKHDLRGYSAGEGIPLKQSLLLFEEAIF